MKMKKILAAVLTAAVAMTAMTACGGSAQSVDNIKKNGKVVMYTNAAFAPFEYREGSAVVGVDADIAAEIAKDLGVELEIQDVEFTSALAAVATGKASFAAAGITVNEERKETMDFSIPYTTSVQYIITAKDFDVKNIEDLKGKKIGVQTGTTGDYLISDEINGTEEEGNHITGVLEGSGASVTGYNNAMSAAQDISTGRIDAVVIDKLPAESIVANNDDIMKCVELVYADGSNTEEEYAIAVEKGNETLLAAINETIKRLQNEGKIDEFLLNHTTK